MTAVFWLCYFNFVSVCGDSDVKNIIFTHAVALEDCDDFDTSIPNILKICHVMICDFFLFLNGGLNFP